MNKDVHLRHVEQDANHADSWVVLRSERIRRTSKFGCLFDVHGCTNVAVAWMRWSDLLVRFLWTSKENEQL